MIRRRVSTSSKSWWNLTWCKYHLCVKFRSLLINDDISVKRRSPGISTNICVHKYFFETSHVWRQVREEEEQAKKELQEGLTGDSPDGVDEDEPALVQFDPIDSRHLSSLPLMQSRVTKLLQSAPHGILAIKNLLVQIVRLLSDLGGCNMAQGSDNYAIVRDSRNRRKRIVVSSLHVCKSSWIKEFSKKFSFCASAGAKIPARSLAFESLTQRTIAMS